MAVGWLVGWLVWTVEIAHSFQFQYAINRPDFGPFSCHSNQPPIKEGSLVVDETLDTGDGTTQTSEFTNTCEIIYLFIYFLINGLFSLPSKKGF